MSFVLKMAWRDSRASRRTLFFSSLSVVLGIAALVSIGSIQDNVRAAIDRETKGLLGADLFVTSSGPFDPSVAGYLQGLRGEQAHERLFSSMMTFPGSGAVRLVQVRALEGAFPFYGELVTEPASAAGRFRKGGPVVLLEETLLSQFKVGIGGTVRLGKSNFTVVGALKKIPGESTFTTSLLAPRALIPMETLQGTGLSGERSMTRHRTMLRLPVGNDPDRIEQQMQEKFRSVRLSFDTVRDRKKEIGQTLVNAERFLSLAGFVALVLGGIGVASALHTHIRRKVPTVALLRCLGASASQAFRVYLVQGLAVGIAGSAMGAVLGVGLQFGAFDLLRDRIPFQIEAMVAWAVVCRGLGAGIVLSVLFALFPLLPIRHVSALAALRSTAESPSPVPDPYRLLVFLGLALAVAGVATAQTASLAMGVGFTGSIGLCFLILTGVAQLIAWAARRLPIRRYPYVVRQGVSNLYRPNNRTVLLILSVGLGTFLLLTLALTRTNLLREVRLSGAGGRPNLLFFDIQDDQVGPLSKLAVSQGVPLAQTAPIVTMRIESVRGRPVDSLLGDRSNPLPAWTLRREYRSTYRGSLSESERIASGVFTGHWAVGPVPISVEEGLFRDMQLQLGDEVEWNVQGELIKSRVGSVRSVEWHRLQPNFFVVFPEGVLEGAPKTYIASVHAQSAEASARLQQAVIAAFPNMTAIDLALVVETLDGLFSKLSYAIDFTALFTVVTALIVMAGALLTGRLQRLREAVLLRILGASRAQITRIQSVEYAVLGLLAAGAGSGLAIAASWGLARFVFHIEPAASFAVVGSAGVITICLTLGMGLLSNRGVTRHPPLEVLRQEN